MGKIFCVGFLKGTFEIPHKISYPYIENVDFISQVQIDVILHFSRNWGNGAFLKLHLK